MVPAELLRLLGGLPSALEFAGVVVATGRPPEAGMLVFRMDAGAFVDE